MNWLRRGAVLAAVLALAAGAAPGLGCGDDDEVEGPSVTLRVTRDFGRELLAEERLPLDGHHTPVQALRASHRVEVNEFGYVAALDGLRLTEEGDDGHSRIWVVNVNGIETDIEPRAMQLVDGDVVQFDYRDIEVRLDVRATVGAFPETFTRGFLGHRFPVRVRCVAGYERSCAQVRRTLREAGVDISGRQPPQPPVTPRLRTARADGIQKLVERAVVHVGPWSRLRDRGWVGRLDAGPTISGIFGRFAPDAPELRLLDWNESMVRVLGPGTGLLGAVRPTEPDLFWVVTGVDRAGVERAASALGSEDLRDAFAAVVTVEGVEKLPLPVRPGSAGLPRRPSDAREFPGRVLVRGVRSGKPDADGGLYHVSSGSGVRSAGRLDCARVHSSPAGQALCIRVSSNGFDYEAIVLDERQRVLNRRRVDGVPSRVRVSRDGRYGAFTMFADDGEGYFAKTSEFSTSTRILDMRDGSELLALEDLDVRRGGRRVELEGAELWGVTFGSEGRFYATLAPAGETRHLLIAGRVGSDRARVVAEHVECPSLSPDGRRIAYKRRIGNSNRWRLHVRDLASGRDWALAEPRSIDDQPEWIGGRLVAYSDGEAVYAVAADGSGEPELLADRATSPAWLPD